jgi:SAM-dependent methyltransferase
MTELLKLHLGVGATGRPAPDWLNCDLYPGDNVDVAFDCMQPWPFEDNSVQNIYASHMLEHLPDIFFFFREAYRVMADRCQMQLRVPYGHGRMAWADPTHLRPYFPESFCFLQPGYNETIHNPQHNAWDAPFVVDWAGLRINQRWLRPLRWRLVKRYLLPHIGRFYDAVDELWIVLFPVKEPMAQQYWRQARAANCVPVRNLVFAHEWEGEPYTPETRLTLLDIATHPPLFVM